MGKECVIVWGRFCFMQECVAGGSEDSPFLLLTSTRSAGAHACAGCDCSANLYIDIVRAEREEVDCPDFCATYDVARAHWATASGLAAINTAACTRAR